MVTGEEVTSWYHVYSENIMYLIVASYQSHNIQPGYIQGYSSFRHDVRTPFLLYSKQTALAVTCRLDKLTSGPLSYTHAHTHFLVDFFYRFKFGIHREQNVSMPLIQIVTIIHME